MKKVEQFFKLSSSNQQLRVNLAERKQSLLMHQKIISQLNCEQSNVNQQILNQLLNKHEEVHSLYATWLLESQIKNEQDMQFRDLLKQYQKRIQQLGDDLVQKQAQLCQKMRTKRQLFAPYEGRVRQFNLYQSEQNNLVRLLNQYKNLSEQIKVLKEEINFKKLINNQESENQIKQKFNPHQKKKNNFLERDLLHQKVYKLLQQELNEQKNLRRQAELLSKEYQELCQKHKQAADKYRRKGQSPLKVKYNMQ